MDASRIESEINHFIEEEIKTDNRYEQFFNYSFNVSIDYQGEYKNEFSSTQAVKAIQVNIHYEGSLNNITYHFSVDISGTLLDQPLLIGFPKTESDICVKRGATADDIRIMAIRQAIMKVLEFPYRYND